METSLRRLINLETFIRCYFEGKKLPAVISDKGYMTYLPSKYLKIYYN